MVDVVGHTREAWQLYASSGRLDRNLLRPEVYRSWERAHVLGADPIQFEAQTLSEGQTEKLLTSEHELIAAAVPFMRALSQAAGQERHAAMLGNAEGIVLDVVGDEQSVHGPERVPGPGALLSEATTGSNGIGTPLAEGDYAQLVGPEHFIGGFHPFTCQGIPLRDAGKTIGVLSTSVRRTLASRRLHNILVCAANGIEAEVLYQRLQRDLAKVLAMGISDQTLLENLRQDVVQAHAIARLKVQAAARLAKDRDPDQELLSSALEAITQFRNRASLWQELAMEEHGAPEPLTLLDAVRNMVDLLETEIATRQVEVALRRTETVTVLADRRQLLRDLLRNLLHALAAAGQGGAVTIEVLEDHKLRLGSVVCHVEAAGGSGAGPMMLAYPRAATAGRVSS